MSQHARALRVLRAYRGATQRELAERAAVSKATVSAYETGKQQIGPTNLGLLLGALDLPFTAWCDTLGFVDRLELLGSRSDRLHRTPPELRDLQREADALARSIGWAEERRVVGVLDFALDALALLGARPDT